MAAQRVLLLADGSGFHGLYPTPQLSVAERLSGGRLDGSHRDIVEERLITHSQKWQRLLRQSEEGWHRELGAMRG